MSKFFHYNHLSPERITGMPLVPCSEIFAPKGEVTIPFKYMEGKEITPTKELLDYWHRAGVMVPKPDHIEVDRTLTPRPEGIVFLRATITTTEGSVFTWSYVFAKVDNHDLTSALENY